MAEPTPAPPPCSTPRTRALIALAIFLALAPEAVQASAGVRTVSPGALERSTAAASPCPTFSWAGVDGAEGYELVVMALVDGGEPRAALRRRIEGSASSFTPDRAACLSPGAYAWSVRAIEPESPATAPGDAWAAPRRFAVEALPSAAELEAALETLRRWQASGPGDPRNSPGTFQAPSNSPGTSQPGPLPGPSPRAAEANVAGTAAIRGEMPGGSGETYGVAGVSASPQGAGVAAVNTGGGADLVLDGTAQGQSDARLFHDALDRPSGNPESFDFRNSGAGAMTLRVDGVDVVTTATDQDTLGALSCADGQLPKRAAGGWACGDDLDLLRSLACGPGQIAKVGPGGNWVCASDDDLLAALPCPDGQIAKRVAGAWACAGDDTGTAGIWSTYPEGADVRVVNQQGNRVAIGNRAMQPVGSFPTEDGALTVSHRAPLPLTAQYNLTLDGRGLQARLAPDMFSPQQDAPLLLNPYGGGVSIGKGAAPTRAGLEIQGSVGHTMAILQRSAGGQGVALVGDWPGLYANAYFDNGVKTMAGSGFSQLINFDQADGAMSFMTSTAANSAADVPTATLEERLRLRKDGALLSSLTQNQFSLAPIAVLSLQYHFSVASGVVTITEQKKVIRSVLPVTVEVTAGELTLADDFVYVGITVTGAGYAELLPVVATDSLYETTFRSVSATANGVSVDYRVGGINGRTLNLSLIVYGMN